MFIFAKLNLRVMNLYAVKYSMKDGKTVYYTTDRKWSQDTFLGTYDLKLANFYKKKGVAKNVMLKEKEITQSFYKKPDDMCKYAIERRNIKSISVVELKISEGDIVCKENI